MRQKFATSAFLVAIVVFGNLLHAESKSPTYQEGKILSVKQVEQGSSAGTDAGSSSAHEIYEIAIQLEDTVYTCTYDAPKDVDLSWLKGKSGQFRVKGKTMFAKRANGSEASAVIRSKSKAPTP